MANQNDLLKAIKVIVKEEAHEIKQDMQDMEERLNDRIDRVEEKLDNRIDQVEKRLDKRIDDLPEQIIDMIMDPITKELVDHDQRLKKLEAHKN